LLRNGVGIFQKLQDSKMDNTHQERARENERERERERENGRLRSWKIVIKLFILWHLICKLVHMQLQMNNSIDNWFDGSSEPEEEQP